MAIQPILICTFVTVYLIIVALLVFTSQYQPRDPRTGDYLNRGETDRVSVFWAVIGTVLFLIASVGWIVVRTTYYNYLMMDLLVLPMFAVFGLALSIATLFLDTETIGTLGSLRFVLTRAVWVVVLLALLVWIVSSMSDLMSGHIRALAEGPQRMSGVIQDKEPRSSRDRIRHVTIDGTQYQVLDLSWWDTLKRGGRIDFLRDPDRTTIFQADQAALTPSGGLFAACAAGVWLVTGGLIVRRLRQIAAAKR